MAGTSGFTLNGYGTNGAPSPNGTLTIYSAATISGPVIVNTGILKLGDGGSNIGSMLNTENFTLNSGGSSFLITNNASTNSISNTAKITSAGGAMNFNSSGNAVAFYETIGSLALEGSGWLQTDPRSVFGQTATVQSTLNLANGLSRGGNGKGILIASGSTSDGGLSTSAGLKLTGHGIANSTAFLPWVFPTSLYTRSLGIVNPKEGGSYRGSSRRVFTPPPPALSPVPLPALALWPRTAVAI